MSELSFLSEKFAPATLPEVYAPRLELLEHFYHAAQDRFIYVNAPAGSGKTVSTLLWLQASGRRAVWLGLDVYDSAPAVFYKQLSTGLFSTQPNNEGMRSVLTSPSFSASPVEHTIHLINEMHPNDEDIALVLDDMHLVNSAEVEKSLISVLRRLPRSFVVIILSRHAAPDVFANLIKEGRGSLITAADLRFSQEEIRQYFGALGRPISREESRFAYMATEGWAIGVNAIAKSGLIDLSNGIKEFARYFETQIWEKWDLPLRMFCLRTCIVDEFDAVLASILSGRSDAREVLDHLSRTNSFLSRIREGTFRYHHLFQDFLRERVTSSGINVSDLYKKAAIYYREQHDYSRALRFWMESGDFKGIDKYMYLFLFENNRGYIADYADFLRTFFVKDFPAHAFREVPALHILCAWYYYITSQHVEFENHMDKVYRNMPRIALGNSKFVEYAILAFSVDHRKSMLTKFKQFEAFRRYVKRFTASGLATNIASFSHNMPYMHRSNQDYSDLALDPDSVNKLDKTFAVLLGAEWRCIRYGLPACFLYERDQLKEALLENNRALDAFGDDNSEESMICMLTLQHSILWRLNEHTQAEKALNRLTELVDSTAPYFIPNLAAYKARLLFMDGDEDAAKAWLDNYFVVKTEHVELFRSYQHFATARAYIVLGDHIMAKHYLDILLDFGRNVNRPLDIAEANILFCALYNAQGRKADADEALNTALMLLMPFGFTRMVADEGATVMPSIKRLLRRIESDNYEGVLTRAYLNEVSLSAYAFSRQHAGLTRHLKRNQRSTKLSRQQRVVLELLAQGYRNAQICEMTGLKLPTVKTHTAILYRKLEVNNAMDAVLRARELHMID